MSDDNRAKDHPTSEHRLARIVASARLGWWDWNIETDDLIWSKECLEMFGFAPDTKMNYDRFIAAIHPEDRERADQAVQKALKSGEEYSIEMRTAWADGSVHWLVSRGRAYFDKSGKAVRMSGAAMDVTQFKETEEKLRQARAEAKTQADNFAAVFDAMPAAAFFSNDRKCEVMISNRAAYDLLRLPYGSNTSKSAPEGERPKFTILENGRELAPEDLPVQKAAATGLPVRSKELEIRFEDGSSIYEFGHAVPLFTEAGEVRGAVGAFLDITDRKVMEQRLRAATDRFQVALRNTPITVFSQDLDLRYKWMYNPVEGYDIANILGKRDADFLERAEDAARLDAIKSEVIRTGKIYHGEVELYHQGTPRTFHVTIEPQRGPQNNVIGITCASFDLTERKLEEAKHDRLARQRQLALDAAKMAWWHYDAATDICEWDENFKEVLGFSVNAMSGKELINSVHPDDVADVSSRFAAALNPADPQPYLAEYRMMRPDGGLVWVEAYAAPEIEGEGEQRRVLSVSGTVRDITARKEIEESLRATKERFEVALRGTPMTVFNQDLDLRITWVYNPVGRHGAAEILGKRDRDLLENPEEAAAGEAIKREVLRTGKSYEGEMVATMNGKPRYYHVNIDPRRDSDGRIVGLTCASFDISEIRRAEIERAKLVKQRQLALNAAKMGWWHYDATSGKASWDETFKQIYGLTADSGSSEEVLSHVHPEDLEQAKSRFERALNPEDPQPYMGEYRVIATDGSVRWVESHGVPEVEGEGAERRVVGCSGTIRDITEKKAAELRVAQNQEAFSKLVEKAPFGVFVVDSQFRIAQMNGGTQAGAFRNVSPVIGRDLGEALRTIWPEPVATEVISVFRHTLETGETYYSPRFVSRRADIDAVEAYEWEVHRIGLPDGQYGVVCYYFDSTRVREAEEALLKQRERHEFIAEGSDVGFWFCDLPFDKVIWDKRVKRHFWLPEDDTPVTMEIFYSLLHPDDREPTRRAIEDSIQNNQQYDVEYRTVSPDGRYRWVRANGRTFYDEAGRPVRFDGITQDVTIRKQAEEALRESEARYRHLAENLDREVQERTIELQKRKDEAVRASEGLRELSTRLLLIQDEERRRIARELHDSAGQILTALGMEIAAIKARARQAAPDLAKQAEGAENLVQQLHSDIRTTSYLLHPPLLDEAGLASAVSWYVRGMTERSGIEVNLDMPPEFGRLPRDMELIVFRLLQESLTNIHRHSGSKKAQIRLMREDHLVTVEVRDEGKGISPARLAAIRSGGSGVGIRGMRERLHQLNGELRIESSPSGTQILATIPIAPVAEENGMESLRVEL